MEKKGEYITTEEGDVENNNNINANPEEATTSTGNTSTFNIPNEVAVPQPLEIDSSTTKEDDYSSAASTKWTWRLQGWKPCPFVFINNNNNDNAGENIWNRRNFILGIVALAVTTVLSIALPLLLKEDNDGSSPTTTIEPFGFDNSSDASPTLIPTITDPPSKTPISITDPTNFTTVSPTSSTVGPSKTSSKSPSKSPSKPPTKTPTKSPSFFPSPFPTKPALPTFAPSPFSTPSTISGTPFPAAPNQPISSLIPSAIDLTSCRSGLPLYPNEAREDIVTVVNEAECTVCMCAEGLCGLLPSGGAASYETGTTTCCPIGDSTTVSIHVIRSGKYTPRVSRLTSSGGKVLVIMGPDNCDFLGDWNITLL